MKKFLKCKKRYNCLIFEHQFLYYIGKIAGAKFDGKKLDDADLIEAEKIKYYNHKEWIIEKMKELLIN